MSVVAPDGSPVALYRRLPAGDDLALIGPEIPAGASVLDLGCGAGRLAHPLADTGCRVTAVDESAEMLAAVRGCETVLSRIQDLRLPRTYDAVLLSGNLLNTADEDERHALLAACARHVAPAGRLLLQRIDPLWAATAQPFESEQHGIRYSFSDVTAGERTLAATIRYRGSGLDATQRFTARVLDDDEVDQALARAGLQRMRWLDQRRTWAVAGWSDG